MNYVYDITLNFNKKLYEFYEWKDTDEPEFILKIPIFRINDEQILNIRNNDIIIEKNVLELIFNKTEVYYPNSIKIIKYACVFVSDNTALAVEFDSNGYSYLKSCISIDEQEDILDYSSNIKYSIIDFKIKKINNMKNKFYTRQETEIQKYLICKIDNMYKNNEYSKLKYIFYEIYNQKIDDIEKIYCKLKNILYNLNDKFYKLRNLVYLIENKKITSN